ncbi:hypothetical protein WAI453_002419 [Rhynchosporium graminicola]
MSIFFKLVCYYVLTWSVVAQDTADPCSFTLIRGPNRPTVVANQTDVVRISPCKIRYGNVLIQTNDLISLPNLVTVQGDIRI